MGLGINKNMPSGHIKVKKVSVHVCNMVTSCQITESVTEYPNNHRNGNGCRIPIRDKQIKQ